MVSFMLHEFYSCFFFFKKGSVLRWRILFSAYMRLITQSYET